MSELVVHGIVDPTPVWVFEVYWCYVTKKELGSGSGFDAAWCHRVVHESLFFKYMKQTIRLVLKPCQSTEPILRSNAPPIDHKGFSMQIRSVQAGSAMFELASQQMQEYAGTRMTQTSPCSPWHLAKPPQHLQTRFRSHRQEPHCFRPSPRFSMLLWASASFRCLTRWPSQEQPA
jgi:hypothetical protein